MVTIMIYLTELFIFAILCSKNSSCTQYFIKYIVLMERPKTNILIGLIASVILGHKNITPPCIISVRKNFMQTLVTKYLVLNIPLSIALIKTCQYSSTN